MTEKLQPQIVVVDNDNTPTTNTLIIAEGTGIQHASVIKLVRQNVSALEEFGLVRFEIRPRSAGQHGGGDTEYAVLNEQQATLLFTFMKNTKIVKEFKIALVKAFYEMAKKLREQETSTAFQIPRTLSQALRLAADLEEKRLALENQIKEDAPKVEFAEELMNSDSEIVVTDAGYSFNVPQRKFFSYLRAQNWLWAHEYRCTAWAIKMQYMRMKPVPKKNKEGEYRHQPVFTSKGYFAIYKKLVEDKIIERNPQLEMSMA